MVFPASCCLPPRPRFTSLYRHWNRDRVAQRKGLEVEGRLGSEGVGGTGTEKRLWGY